MFTLFKKYVSVLLAVALFAFKGYASEESIPDFKGKVKVSLNCNTYTFDQLITIGKSINDHQITELTLYENISMFPLAQGLKGNTSLTNITFWGITFNEQKGLADFVAAVSLARLTTLNIWNCTLGGDSQQILINLMGQATNLKHVDFGYSSLEGQGLLSLVTILKDNKFKGKLLLESIQHTQESVQTLAHILKENIAISHLNLKHCELQNDDLELILNALKDNHYLTHLDMGYNSLITESGAKTLSHLLEVNKTLKILDIMGLKIQSDHMVEIAQGLSKNISLTHISLSSYYFGEGGSKALVVALWNHPHLRIRGDEIADYLKTYKNFKISKSLRKPRE